jgi:drug/metabolite transporter (DMT)-like permease
MISTIVLAVVFLGESITAIKVIGDAVILAAVLVTVRSKG